MTVRTLTYAVAAILGITLAGPVSAQGPPLHGDPKQPGGPPAPSVLYADWRQAWQQSRGNDNPEVRALLVQAKSLLDQAKEETRRGNTQRATMLEGSAARLLQRARQMMYPHGQAGTPQQSQQALREAEEMLVRIRRHGMHGPHGRQMESLVMQARQAAADGQHGRALRLATLAQDQGRRAWHESMQSRMMQQRCVMLETVVEPLVDRAAKLAEDSDDERMRRISERAEERLHMAHEVDADTRAGQKALLLEAAMRDAERVFKNLDRTGYDRHRADRAIVEAEAALRRASELLSTQDGGDGSSLVQRGEDLVRQARERLNDGDVAAAQENGRQARELAQQAIQQSLGPLTPENVAEAIERTQQLMDGTTPDSPDAEKLLELARERQSEAQAALENGRLRAALAKTRIAARLAQRARATE